VGEEFKAELKEPLERSRNLVEQAEKLVRDFQRFLQEPERTDQPEVEQSDREKQ